MERVNIELLTKNFNNFRLANQGKTFTSNELYKIFHEMGFNKAIAQSLTKFLNSEKRGTTKIYTFTKEPVYKGKIEQLYNKPKKHIHAVNAEDAAVALLKSKNYKVYKPIGFDVESFKKDYPDIYVKYIKYETL